MLYFLFVHIQTAAYILQITIDTLCFERAKSDFCHILPEFVLFCSLNKFILS